MSEKAKYWSAIIYPESMDSDWQDKISDVLQIPSVYCIHDKDKDGHNGDRKVHVHLILAFPNTTTYKHALSVVQLIAPTCLIVKKVINIRYYFDYLIHDTENCKKLGKYLYDVSERICINNFDIGMYEQRSLEEKQKDAKLLKAYIFKHLITNMFDLELALQSDPNIDDDLYDRFEDVQLSYSGFISNCCKGCYLHLENCVRQNKGTS